MNPPLFSTITLVMELFVITLIFWIVYRGYAKNRFIPNLALFAVVYEILFNVGYMLYRTLAHPAQYALTPFLKTLAASHGILSLVMMHALMLFFFKAARGYRQGVNYFAAWPKMTLLFLALWCLSLLSGLLLYIRVYF